MSAEAMTPQEITSKLRKGPFHEWLGLEVISVGEGEIELTAKWREEWVVNPASGYTHGGILATLIDLTADWSLVSIAGRAMPTIDLRVDYHRPAMQGDLTCKGRVVKSGKSFSVCEASVHDAEGKLLASGRGVYSMPKPT